MTRSISPGEYKLIVIRSDGAVQETTTSGYLRESLLDQAFHEAAKSPHTIYAVVFDGDNSIRREHKS